MAVERILTAAWRSVSPQHPDLLLQLVQTKVWALNSSVTERDNGCKEGLLIGDDTVKGVGMETGSRQSWRQRRKAKGREEPRGKRE